MLADAGRWAWDRLQIERKEHEEHEEHEEHGQNTRRELEEKTTALAKITAQMATQAATYEKERKCLFANLGI